MTLHQHHTANRGAPTTHSRSGSDGEAARGSLSKTIAAVEQRAIAPPIVGEVADWCRRVATALEELMRPRNDLSIRHAEIRRELVREDPQLSARSRSLRRRQHVVTNELHELTTEATRLGKLSRSSLPDEPIDEARDLRIRILAWCVAARALEGELESAFLEAHYRDRGRVD